MAGASVVEAWQLRLRGCSGGGNGGPRRLCIALVEMLDDALDDGGAFDAGDDPGVGAAGIADIDVNVDRAVCSASWRAAKAFNPAIRVSGAAARTAARTVLSERFPVGAGVASVAEFA
ncbi:MAG: hypothetical protein O7H40_08805 [Gammaproteobacteria bacterium]|nr:hypothetical protein [Gammaproteobacteria bacterium]